MLDYSTTDHMALHNLYGALDLISKDFSVFRVVIYLLKFSDIFSTSI